MKKTILLFSFLVFWLTGTSQVTSLARIGQTPGGAGFHVNYDSAGKRLIVGCGTSVWVYDCSDTNNIHVIARHPLQGLINETDLYGNVLFAAATHDGVWAMDITSPDLDSLAHYSLSGDTAAYDMWRTNDTIYVADNFKIRELRYIPGTGFTRLATFGPDNSFCVARRGNTIAVGSQGFPKGSVTIYNSNDLSTPLASFQSSKIWQIQDLQFADRLDDIIYVCCGPEDIFNTISNFMALQFTGNDLVPLDTFRITGGIPGFAQINIMNMDSRNDTLFLVTTAAFNLSTLPFSYMPILDATGLPGDTLKKIGYVISGLWHFDAAVMKGTPYLAIASEWCGVLISNVSHLNPYDTLGFLETGGWCEGSRIRHDTLWVLHEGYGLAAYKRDSLYYSNGFMKKSKILHIYRQFLSDFDFLNDTLIILTSSYGDIYNLKPWLNGGTPVKTDSLGIGNNLRTITVQTNMGTRLVTGWNNLFAPPEVVLLVDPFSPVHPRPLLDSIQIRDNLFSLTVSGDTLYCGKKFNNDFYLAAYQVKNDSFCLIDTVPVPAEVNSISIEHGRIAIGSNMNVVWFTMEGGEFHQMGSYFDWNINIQAVKIRNRYLYAADKFHGLKVFDVSTPPDVQLVAESRGTGGWKNLFGSDAVDVGPDGEIYLGDFNGGITLIASYDTLMNSGPGPIRPSATDPVTIFPNPFMHSVMVRITDEHHFSAMTLRVYDIYGNIIFESPLKQTLNELKFGDHPSGVYIFRIEEHGQTFSKKVIKL